MTKPPLTNPGGTKVTDRAVTGPQRDASTPTGQLPAQPDQTVLGNVSGVVASPVPLTGAQLGALIVLPDQPDQTLSGNNTGAPAPAAPLTAAQSATLLAGGAPFSGSVALAKLTGGGANGSLTVVNGLIKTYSAPT